MSAVVRRDGGGVTSLGGRAARAYQVEGGVSPINSEARGNGRHSHAGGLATGASSASFEGRIGRSIAIYDRALSDDGDPAAGPIALGYSGGSGGGSGSRRAEGGRSARAQQLAGPRSFAADYGEVSRGDEAGGSYWTFDSKRRGESRWKLERRMGRSGSSRGSAVETVQEPRTPQRNMAARFHGGRVTADANRPLPMDYSVSLWFRNDQPNSIRAR